MQPVSECRLVLHQVMHVSQIKQVTLLFLRPLPTSAVLEGVTGPAVHEPLHPLCLAS
jgi:hypothetical protein